MPGNPNIILRTSTYQYGSTTGIPLTYTQLDGNFIYLDNFIRTVVPLNATSASFADTAMTTAVATSASFATTATSATTATNSTNALTASYIGNTVGLLNQNVIVSGTLSVSPYPTNYLAGKVNVSSFDYRYNAVNRVLTLSSIESSGGTPSTQLTFNQEGGSNGSSGWSIQSTNLFDNSAGTPLRLNQYGGNIIIGSSTDAGARLYISSTSTDYTNSAGTNSHILMNNPSSFGQSSVTSIINGSIKGKWRTDYIGGNAFSSYGNQGYHMWLTNGDYGVGQSQMIIQNNGNVKIAYDDTTDNGYKLEVAGTVALGNSTSNAHSISGNLTLNGNSAHVIYGNVQLYNSPFQINNSYQVISYSNTDQTNTNASNAHLVLTNSNTNAQTVLAAHTSNGLRGKWRVDYQGKSNYVAYTTSGSHTFWINGDSTDGGTAVLLITGSTVGIGTTTPRQTYALDVATIGNFRSGLTITGSLTTSGSTLTQIGNVIVTGSLLVTGSNTLTGTTTIIGTSTISGSLLITGSNTLIGTKTITGSVFISGSKTIIGTTTLTGSLNVTGSQTLIGNQVLIGTKTVSGSVFITGSKTIIGDNTITGSLFVTGSQTFIGTKTITGSIFITGSKTIIGTNIITGSLLATGSHTLAGTVTIANLLTLPTYSGALPTGVNVTTGSIAASGSGANCKLYFFNGVSTNNGWNALF
jgi:fibronectin-binding autotransporter adhesin